MACPTIGKSNIQRVFVVQEDVSGTLQRPTAAGYIQPAGQASMSQTPDYANSEELSASLNTLEQFQNAVGAGDISIPMYLRLVKDYTAPQGNDLLTSLMGDIQTPDTVTAAAAAAITDSDVSIQVDTVAGGYLPPRGVVMISTEKIRYTKKTESTATSGLYTLSGCTRGYGGTTAASHLDGDTVTLKSRVWLQNVCRNTVSVWVQFDHFVAFMSGCVPTQLTAPMSNTGGQMLTTTLQGRRMGWAGTSTVASAAAGVITLGAEQADAYAVGAIVKNKTKNDDNSGAGYTVTAVDADNDTITVSPAPTGWAEDDILEPWLPEAAGIGEAVESRSTRVFIDGATGKRREGDITISTPTTFASEIGDEYPGENADSKRELTISGGMYFRASDAKQFGLGYKGYEKPMDILFGDKAGQTLAMSFPRVKFNTPTISTDGEFYTLTQDGAALGVSKDRGGESSLFLIQE